MNAEERQERELEAGEMWLAGTVDALSWAPIESPIYNAARAMLPEIRFRLEVLGWQQPLRQEDLASPPEPPR